MPGPVAGYSKKERKRVKRKVRSGATLGRARASVMTSRRPERVRDLSRGVRRIGLREVRRVERGRRLLAQSGISAAQVAKRTGLSNEQAQVLTTILRTGKKMGATPKELLSAVQTGLVEANLTNPAGGHGTSVGWRQEIDTYGSVGRRMNVKGAARRYFQETAAAGRGAGMSSGQLSQAVQRSAYPSRYDERVGEATQILEAGLSATRPADKAKARRGRRLIKTGKQRLQRIGLTRLVKKPEAKPATIVTIGKVAQKRFGLTVGENSAFTGTTPTGGHAPNSFHYSDSAIDVTGPSEQLAAFNRFVAKKYGSDLEEMYYDPGINIDNGQTTGAIGGHGTHVHVAETKGASRGIAGAMPTGGSVPSGGTSGPTARRGGGQGRDLLAELRRLRRKRGTGLPGKLPTVRTYDLAKRGRGKPVV